MSWVRRGRSLSRPSKVTEPVADASDILISLPQKTLFRLDEVAEHCDVSKKTIDKWINEGKLKAIKLPNGYRRVPYAELLALLQKNSS